MDFLLLDELFKSSDQSLFTASLHNPLSDPFTTSAFCMTQTFVPVVRSLLLVIITLSNFSSSFHSVLISSRVTV